MIINKRIYTGVGYFAVGIRSLFQGGRRIIRSLLLLEKSETLRDFNSSEFNERIQFPLIRRSDATQCDFCGDCASVCPTASLTAHKKKIMCDLSICLRCGLCLEACTKGILKLEGTYNLYSATKEGGVVNIVD